MVVKVAAVENVFHNFLYSKPYVNCRIFNRRITGEGSFGSCKGSKRCLRKRDSILNLKQKHVFDKVVSGHMG